jgi:hypothetical protein
MVKSRLANVRLDEARVRKARALRERGVTLSEIVREAIDRRFDEEQSSARRGDGRAILAAIFEEFPDPARLPPRSYDVHDRRQARQAILRRLGRKRR